MSTKTEADFPIYDFAMELPSSMIGHTYNELRARCIRLESVLREIAGDKDLPDRIKIHAHQAAQ